MTVKKLSVVAIASCLLLSACSSENSAAPSSSSTTVTTTNPPTIKTTIPVDSVPASEDTQPDPEALARNKECGRVRPATPKPTEFDSWDSPGVLTTSVNIDPDGNTIITGLMSDEHDFDVTSKRKTVGVDGWSFKFLAKFNERQEFLWMKCQGEKTLFHFYTGPMVNTDAAGNIYQCDAGLSKFSPAGKLLWSTASDALSCATNSSGESVLAGPEAHFVDTKGKTIWSAKNCSCSAATFDQEGNIFVGSQNGISKFSTSGKRLWGVKFTTRDIEVDGAIWGPNGYSEGNAVGTDQVGIRTDKDNNILFVFSLNLKNDLDPSSKTKNLKPGWIQDVVIAKYTAGGELLWAQKVKIPKTVAKTTRYGEGYDISFTPNGDIIVLGGGKLGKKTDQDLRLFLAKFTTDGEQTRFMWLGEYLSFIHNMGHHIVTDTNGRTYVTSAGEKLPPFLISRDM
ncbi:MAG: hypothetical protein JHC59_06840 [Ilumatobacteraceae bacterium]|nr:hypothetical protein [Ilumatobacteraceae bacterium]